MTVEIGAREPYKLLQVLDMALRSAAFKSSSVHEWISHLVTMACRKHLILAVEKNVVLAFGTWFRCAEPIVKPSPFLPKDLDSGEYIQPVIICIRDGYSKGTELIHAMRDAVIEKSEGARYWVGHNRHKKEYVPRVYEIRR